MAKKLLKSSIQILIAFQLVQAEHSNAGRNVAVVAQECQDFERALESAPERNLERVQERLIQNGSRQTIVGSDYAIDLIRSFTSNQRNFQNVCRDAVSRIEEPAESTAPAAQTEAATIVQATTVQAPANDNEPKKEPTQGDDRSPNQFCLDRDVEKYTCRVDPNFDFSKLAIAPLLTNLCNINRPPETTNSPYSECKCLVETKNIFLQRKDDITCMTKEQEAEESADRRKDMMEDLYEKFGEKFLDDYARVVENGIYFDKTLKMFEGSTNKDDLLCTNVQLFKNEIDSKCGRSVSAKTLQDRTSVILNALNNAGDSKDFADQFQKINNGIAEMPIGNQVFKRETMDAARETIAKSLPYPFFKSMIEKLIKLPGAKKEFETSNNIVITLSKLLRSEASNPEKFISENIKVSDFSTQKEYDDFVKFIRTPKQQRGNPFVQGLRSLMVLDPLYQRQLSSTHVFKLTLSKLKPNEKFGDYIHKDFEHIKLDQALRCQKVRKELAEAACMSESEILSKVDKRTIFRAMNLGSASMHEKRKVAMLMCESGLDPAMESRKTDSPFSQLNYQSSGSDFYARFKGSSANLFRQIAELVKEDTGGRPSPVSAAVRTQVQRAIQNAVARGSYSGSVADLNEFMSGSSSSSSTRNNVVSKPSSQAKAEPIASAAKAETSEEAIVKDPAVAAAIAPPTFNPAPFYSNTPQQQERPQTEKANDPKKKLADSLCQGPDCESVKRLVDNLDDKSAQELAEFQRQKADLQRQIDETRAQNEKLRQELQRDFQTTRDQSNALASKTAKAMAASRTPASVDGSNNNIVQAQAIPEAQNIVQRSQNISSTAAPTRDAAAARVGNAGNGSQAAALGSANLSKYNIAPAQGGPVSLSTRPGANPSLNITSSKDVSTEVLKYLNEGNPDVRTLLQIKQSGMVYKYKVLENGQYVEKEVVFDYSMLDENVKKFIDQKIASSGVSPSQINQMDTEIKELKRTASYNQLRAVITEMSNRR